MEGEGVSVGSVGGVASGGGGGFSSGSSFGGGFESIGDPSPSVGNAGPSTTVSIFEGPVIETLDSNPMAVVEQAPVVETAESVPTVLSPEITTIESGIINAVREEGTPEAGLRFLSDVPIISEDSPVLEPASSDETTVPGDEPAVESIVGTTQPEIEPLTPEQKQVHDFLGVNPEYLSAFGHVLSLGPEAMELLIKSLKRVLEEEQQKAGNEEEKKKLKKWEIGLLAFLFLLQLAFSAVEKGAKEASR